MIFEHFYATKLKSTTRKLKNYQLTIFSTQPKNLTRKFTLPSEIWKQKTRKRKCSEVIPDDATFFCKK